MQTQEKTQESCKYGIGITALLIAVRKKSADGKFGSGQISDKVKEFCWSTHISNNSKTCRCIYSMKKKKKEKVKH